MAAKHSGSAAEESLKGPYYPLGNEGPENTETRATATCFCGAVRLSFPVQGEGYAGSFICNCTDCRKITASMFASNFTIDDRFLAHERGGDKLRRFAQNKTIATGNTMANYFCSVCGTLMYRRSTGYAGFSILRIGTVDDFHLHETKLRPRLEAFVKDRVSWFAGGRGVEQHYGIVFANKGPLEDDGAKI